MRPFRLVLFARRPLTGLAREQGGTYRKIVHLPQDVSYRLLVSTSPNEDLAQSDEDRVLGRPAPKAGEYKEEDGPLKEGESLALQVELTLGSSTCAFGFVCSRDVTLTSLCGQTRRWPCGKSSSRAQAPRTKSRSRRRWRRACRATWTRGTKAHSSDVAE